MDIVVSVGDINGIGPEIALKAFQQLADKPERFFYFAPYNVFIETYNKQRCDFKFNKINLNEIDKVSDYYFTDSGVFVVDLGECSQNIGIPTEESGNIAYKSLMESLKSSKILKTDFLITAPLSKEALKMAGINFIGHTEILANWCNGTKEYLMMFLAENMKVALVTIHESLASVPSLITYDLVELKVNIVKKTLINDFGIRKPRIAVLGLNPHAGENGLLGSEENTVLIPLIEKNKEFLFGPFPSDAFFGMQQYLKYDIILAMYHDQGLIPFKMLNFSSGVNFTAGLPIIRTSPDHGTAFDIAGKNLADPDSFLKSYTYGRQIKQSRSLLVNLKETE